jgi:hypothetical protein
MPQNNIVSKTCYVCQNTSHHLKRDKFQHPDSLGPSKIVDLDGRPKELTEYILKNLLEVCPHCGYVAENIEKPTSINREYLRSPEYMSLCHTEGAESPYLFLRAAFIKLGEQNHEKAITYYVYAAWCADSRFQHELALQCRKNAISLIFSNNKSFADISSKKWVQVIDLIRRYGDFQAVINHCTTLLPIAGPILTLGMEYELILAKNNDRESHTNIDAATVIQNRARTHSSTEKYVIAGKVYSIEENGYGSGWAWISETRTLILTNYHASAIEVSGSVTIRIDQADNHITSPHGPAIHVLNGDLKITGYGILSIKAEEQGIFVSSGSLEVQQSVLDIRTKGNGMHASGTIYLTNNTVIEIHSRSNGLISDSGNLHSNLGTVLKIFGEESGVIISRDVTISTGLYHIESSQGSGIQIHHGSLSLADCLLDIISSEICIHIKNGNLVFNGMKCNLHGSCGIVVHGMSSFEKSLLTICGDETGLFVSRDAKFTGGRFECSAKNALSIKGSLQIANSNITASGENAICSGGDFKLAGGILILNGDTVMHVSNNFEISDGLIIGVGKLHGIIIEGSYTQSGGDITISGESHEGMKISGKEMIMTHGILKTNGRTCGLEVSGNVFLLGFTLFASGNIGFSVQGSLKMDKGELNVTGEEIGISLKGGSLHIGSTLSVIITGNTGIYAINDIEIAGSSFHVSGQFAGVVQEKGNLIINGGAIDISAEEYGILVQSGSMNIQGGIITVMNTRMKDLGGSGIVVAQGNFHANSLLTVNGESIGISVPNGTIAIQQGSLKAYGYRSAIIGESLHIRGFSSLTAYGKTQGAIILTNKEFLDDERIHFWAGTSEKTAIEDVYKDQRYVHAYTDEPRIPDSMAED